MSDSVKNSGPSYFMSAIGGLFLGVLGAAIMIIFPEQKWIAGIVPLFCIFASVLGTYIAAEPYDELRERYDKLTSDGLNAVTPQENFALDEIKKSIEEEGARLVKKAAELGEDGVELAKAGDEFRMIIKKIEDLNESKQKEM